MNETKSLALHIHTDTHAYSRSNSNSQQTIQWHLQWQTQELIKIRNEQIADASHAMTSTLV